MPRNDSSDRLERTGYLDSGQVHWGDTEALSVDDEHRRCWKDCDSDDDSSTQCLLDQRCLSAKEKSLAPTMGHPFYTNNASAATKKLVGYPQSSLDSRRPRSHPLQRTSFKQLFSIAHEFGRAQAESIFVNPLRRLAEFFSSMPLVVIIDEFQPADSSIRRKFTTIFKNCRVLILSRPEDDILWAIHANVETEHHDLTTQVRVA